MRGAGRHSSLVDIVCPHMNHMPDLTTHLQATIRMLMSIGGLVPLPSDALVTPVTFRVKKRNLRGILAPFDAAETGSRELSGEWVVGKRTWQRLQAEWKATQARRTSPDQKTGTKEQVILYVHGGTRNLLVSIHSLTSAHPRCLLSFECRSTEAYIYPHRQVY